MVPSFPSPAEAWAVPRFEALAFRQWPEEGEGVVHDESSGQTHLVSELGCALLQALAAGAQDTGRLVRRFSGWFEPNDTPEAIALHLQETLRELQYAGLVTREAAPHLEAR